MTPPQDGQSDLGDGRVRSRCAVLRLGTLLGWGHADTVAFAEALVGRPWRLCSARDLETVAGEYVALARAVAAKARRRARRPAAPAGGRDEP